LVVKFIAEGFSSLFVDGMGFVVKSRYCQGYDINHPELYAARLFLQKFYLESF
jgi:hypothetical protein